ncbi:MAG: ATP-dependent DNA helicase [Gemmatimonadales bacterium]|nr:ATP-dependent DNA helicase [Gemmatimonadales bacterium]
MSLNQDLLLARRWGDQGRLRWLAVDLLGGDRILELEDPTSTISLAPQAIVVCEGELEPETVPGGGLAFSEGMLWSLLDPCRAIPDPANDSAYRVAVETDLRRACSRFRHRVSWWRGLDIGLKESCRSLLKGYLPDLLPLLELLDAAPVSGLTVGSFPVEDDFQPFVSDGVGVHPPLDPEGVYSWFQSQEGLGALYGSGFTARVEQAQMAREVGRALTDGQPLLVEAGTGVGKTLAYLVPLLAGIRERDIRAVVSTHTRALQSQILTQDLPRLSPLLGDRKFALLMGRKNYLCLRQRQTYLTAPIHNLGDALRAVVFRLWLSETKEGLREELADHTLLASELGTLFDSVDLCLPGLCYEGDSCFVQKARKRAREADLVVVNHALLLHDMRLGHTLIGGVDQIVVDEAHRLPAVVLETHGVGCSMARLDGLEDLLGRVRGTGPPPERIQLASRSLSGMGAKGERAAVACDDYGKTVGRVFTAFRKWWRALGQQVEQNLPPGSGYRDRLRIRDKDEAFGELREDTALLLERLAEASAAYAALAVRASDMEDLSESLEDHLAQLAQAGQLLNHLHRDVHFLTQDPDEDWVTWVSPGGKGGIRLLGATLLESGGVLREYWQESDIKPVMTSATLAVGEDYSHMLNELGLSRRRPPTLTTTCLSPFDFHSQVLMLTPGRFPAPDAAGFGAAVGDLLADLAGHSPRKAMALFTSYHLLNNAAERLTVSLGNESAPGTGVKLLVQKPRSATGALLEQFRREPRAMLLGTNTFWEGVDFPGQDLEILVVTKLPFLVPNDPWVEARCERVSAAGENPFTNFIVRDAVLRLRQGTGRLIRRETDRGIIILLDNRLHTKNYGGTFLGALPMTPVPFTGSVDLLARIDEFFRGG